ncbi:MAG TPA: S8 family serine peptidase, partial [Candidatus Thermoplasmatota archaeon]|nr:S8 family serine peptidase [Candidatus Thermoplasmatota archaeon]
DPTTPDGSQIVLIPTALERPRLSPSLANPLALGDATKDVAQKAIARGVVLVVAAGDQSNAHPLPPGDLPGALVVGAVDRTGARAEFGSKGASLDVLAPGILVGPWPEALDTLDFAEDGYSSVAGSGVAAAFAAGVVALLMEGDPELAMPTQLEALGLRKVAAVEKAVKSHAVPLGGKPDEEGAGLIAAEPSLKSVDRGGHDLDWSVVGAMAAIGALVFALFARSAWTKAKERARRPKEPAG